MEENALEKQFRETIQKGQERIEAKLLEVRQLMKEVIKVSEETGAPVEVSLINYNNTYIPQKYFDLKTEIFGEDHEDDNGSLNELVGVYVEYEGETGWQSSGC